MAKKKETKKQAVVFAVPSDESSSGKHEVIFASDGDLNKATQRGNIKKFSDWNDTESFAHRKGKDMRAKVIIHSYRLNPTYTVDYKEKQVLRTVPKITNRSKRITPKTPKLRR